MLKTIILSTHILKTQARAEAAYLGNLWGNALSTTLYTVSAAIFIDLLYKRVGSLGDFSRNDMLFALLVNQVSFYCFSSLIFSPMYNFIFTINKGSFDFVLLRPVPKRVLAFVQEIKPIYFFASGIPPVLFTIIMVDWSITGISLVSALLGLVVFICGIMAIRSFTFLFVLPAFTIGESTELLGVSLSGNNNEIPFHLMPNSFKIASFLFIPHIVSVGAAVAVMLQKMPALPVVSAAIALGIASSTIYRLAWNYGIRHYTSASS